MEVAAGVWAVAAEVGWIIGAAIGAFFACS